MFEVKPFGPVQLYETTPRLGVPSVSVFPAQMGALDVICKGIKATKFVVTVPVCPLAPVVAPLNGNSVRASDKVDPFEPPFTFGMFPALEIATYPPPPPPPG